MMSGPFWVPANFIPFLDFYLKLCHAIFVFNNTTKEQYYRKNEGGIFYIFENHTQENTHIKTQTSRVLCGSPKCKCHLKATPP